MTSKSADPFETANRMKKAVALADAIDGAGLTADDAVLMDSGEWEMLGQAASVKMPSQLTAQLVILLLARREAARKIFAGRTRHRCIGRGRT